MKHDWTNAELVYTTGNLTLKGLGERHGIPWDTVRTHAARHNWTQKRRKFRESVTARYLDEARTDAVLERAEFDRAAHVTADIGIAVCAVAITDENSTESLAAIIEAAQKATNLKYRLLDIAQPKLPIEIESKNAFEIYQRDLAAARASVENQVDGDGMATVELEPPDTSDN